MSIAAAVVGRSAADPQTTPLTEKKYKRMQSSGSSGGSAESSTTLIESNKREVVEFKAQVVSCNQIHEMVTDTRKEARDLKTEKERLALLCADIGKQASLLEMTPYNLRKVNFILQEFVLKLSFVYANVGVTTATMTKEKDVTVCFYNGYKYVFAETTLYNEYKWKCASSRRRGCSCLFTDRNGVVFVNKLPSHFHFSESKKSVDAVMPKLLPLPPIKVKPGKVKNDNLTETLFTVIEQAQKAMDSLVSRYNSAAYKKEALVGLISRSFKGVKNFELNTSQKLFFMSFLEECQSILEVVDFGEQKPMVYE